MWQLTFANSQTIFAVIILINVGVSGRALVRHSASQIPNFDGLCFRSVKNDRLVERDVGRSEFNLCRHKAAVGAGEGWVNWVKNTLISISRSLLLPSAVMSAKAISEQTGKEFLYKYICTAAAVQNRFRYANVTTETDWERLTQEHPWLLTEVGVRHWIETWYFRCR